MVKSAFPFLRIMTKPHQRASTDFHKLRQPIVYIMSPYVLPSGPRVHTCVCRCIWPYDACCAASHNSCISALASESVTQKFTETNSCRISEGYDVENPGLVIIPWHLQTTRSSPASAQAAFRQPEMCTTERQCTGCTYLHHIVWWLYQWCCSAPLFSISSDTLMTHTWLLGMAITT